MGNVAYLPFASGLLCAYAKTSDQITSHYEFAPFLFYRDTPERILKKYDNPSVAAFSTCMWNEQLNLHVAKELKKRYPECLVVFGGPQVPFDPTHYFKRYPFIDISVRGEGEEAFLEILRRAIDSRDFSGIPGVSWREQRKGDCVVNPEEDVFDKDLDRYPSPYLEGLYEYLFTEDNGLVFQTIMETNRGCPFRCAFCFWGKGELSKKFRFHSIERVKSEIIWCAEHSIQYLFFADSNFGIHKRDYQITSFLAEIKKKYGYPEKLRTCFTRTTDDKVFKIGMFMHKNELGKGITISRQSNSKEVLKNINRTNIPMSRYKELLYRFNAENVPVYSELIVGLPGETYGSFIEGVEEHLQAGLRNQLFIYLCEVYPNTELADNEYKKRWGIKTQKVIMTEIHGSPREKGEVGEYKEIIIETNSMPLAQWRRSVRFGWVAMLLHSMKLGFFLLKYAVDRYGVTYRNLIEYICEGKMPQGRGTLLRKELERFDFQLDNLIAGGGQGHALPEYGLLYWDEEEASFLRISENLDLFYSESLELLKFFLTEQSISYDEGELAEAVMYQEMRIPSQSAPVETEKQFSFNFPEYFESCFQPVPVPLRPKPQLLILHPTDFRGDKERYAREVILWGRKSDTILIESSWRSLIKS